MPSGVNRPIVQPLGEDGLTVGERVLGLRVERDLSQRHVAERATKLLPEWRGTTRGVTAAYLSRIEKGERMPSIIVIRALACALKVTPSFLEHGVETDPVVHALLRKVARLEQQLAAKDRALAKAREQVRVLRSAIEIKQRNGE